MSQDLRWCYTSQDLSYESRACDGDWKPIYTGEYCRTCSVMGCRAVSGCNVFTCYPPSCEDLPPDVPYYPPFSSPDCIPDDSKCRSTDDRDCCTDPDLSVESRACDGDWKPIYTGEERDFLFTCNVFTCYPPSCEDLPPDVPYHPTHRARETFLIIVLVLVVVGVVGGIVGGVLCCWCAKCCCFVKKKPVAAATATATATELVATATAVPVAVPTATRFP
jgi:hypothetical protein